MPSAEPCNGHDDDCDDLVDELACDSSAGCTGFTLSDDPNHGYMFCSGHENWATAQQACSAQDMRGFDAVAPHRLGYGVRSAARA